MTAASAPHRAPPVGVIAPSLVLSMAMMGDTLLYAVLPLYAAEFGVSLFVVGVLLSLNRWVRLVANSVVAAFGERVGPRRLMIAAAATATLSTLGYVVAPREEFLMAARVLWGLSFAALNLSLLAYAVSDRANAGKRLGAGRAAIGLFQGGALVGGALLVAPLGPRDVFLVMAAFGAAAMVVSWRLPTLRMDEPKRDGFRLPLPGRLEIWGFSLGVVVDGIFLVTLSLLFKDAPLPFAPVVVAGALLATRWAMEVVTAPIGGALADRYGARPLAIITGIALVGGLIAIALGHSLPGAALVVVTRGIYNTLLPVMIAERPSGGTMSSQARYSTWRDFGAAVGPMVAGALFAAVPTGTLYGACAASLGVALWWCVARR
ncbi:MAG: MFS transporter [Rhodospirillales bacterium]|nr:MAG: MFS transporter [Rhodospirillales bacterium]